MGKIIEKKGIKSKNNEQQKMVIHSNPQIVCRLWINRGEIFFDQIILEGDFLSYNEAMDFDGYFYII